MRSMIKLNLQLLMFCLPTYHICIQNPIRILDTKHVDTEVDEHNIPFTYLFKYFIKLTHGKLSQ